MLGFPFSIMSLLLSAISATSFTANVALNQASTSSPSKQLASGSDIPSETSPFYLTDLVILESNHPLNASDPHDNNTFTSSISFFVNDINPELTLNNTLCQYNTSSSGQPVTTIGYVACENPSLGFSYSWREYAPQIWIGQIGLIHNYDFWDENGNFIMASNYGWWNVSAHPFGIPGGTRWIQGCLEIYVTAIVSSKRSFVEMMLILVVFEYWVSAAELDEKRECFGDHDRESWSSIRCEHQCRCVKAQKGLRQHISYT
jgi:hypothetical protein